MAGRIPENKQETLSVDTVLDDLIKQVFNLIPEKLHGNKKLFDSLSRTPLLLADIPSNDEYTTNVLCAQYEALLIIKHEKILEISSFGLAKKLAPSLFNNKTPQQRFFDAIYAAGNQETWIKLHPVIIDDKTFDLGKALQTFADRLLPLKKTA